MSAVPLPVKVSWYAYHFAASTFEAQMRMTHACWMAMMQAHPLAPHGLAEVRKAATGPDAAPAPGPAKPRRAARPKPAQAKPAKPARKPAKPRPAQKPAPAARVAAPQPAAAPEPAATVARAPEPAAKPAEPPKSGQKRKTRAPSAPPPMPKGTGEG